MIDLRATYERIRARHEQQSTAPGPPPSSTGVLAGAGGQTSPVARPERLNDISRSLDRAYPLPRETCSHCRCPMWSSKYCRESDCPHRFAA